MNVLQILLYNTFGALLTFFYRLTSNYGFALILFTLVTRALLFPLAIKQQRSTAEMARMRPKLEEMQKKYAKDKAKLNEANMKLYQEEGYNPLGGCLPMIVQLPIIMGLYAVISSPLSFIYNLSSTQINDIIGKLKPFISNYDPKNAQTFSQSVLATLMYKHQDQLINLPKNITLMKFDIAGIDLTQAPGMRFTIYLLIPILCYITQFLSSWLSIRMTSAANPQQAKGMNTSMIVFMPLITTWFSLTVPASLGFYWVVSNIFMIIQVLILNKFYHPMKLAEIAQQKSNLKKQSKLDGQMSEIDQKLLPDLTEQNLTENNKETNRPKNMQQKNQNGKKNNQKKFNKYNNKKRLAASRKIENINTSDKE
jgi:YidC/Oxa1 family membrane protein insertase